MYGECPNGPIEVEMCIDPVTDAQYVCPPPAERRVFSDGGALSNELSSRVDASTATLAAYEQQQGFQSLRAYLDGGEEFTTGTGEDPTGNEAVALQNDGVVRSDFPVGDAILSLMNSRGEIQVGDSVYKVTRDNVFAVHVVDVAVLQQKVPTLSSPPPSDGDPRIAVAAVETTVPPESQVMYSRAPAPGGPAFHHVPGVGGVCYVNAGSSYRMRGKSYKTFWFFYTEAGVTTEWERKKKFLWTSYWANTYQSGTLSYSFTSTLTQGQIGLPGSNPVGPPSGSFSWTGTSRIHRTLAWGIFHRIYGQIHSTHTVSNSQAAGSCQTAA
ncbi:MAG TPA: hypothetical protein VFR81_07575 [Longimicrobium sp.]|nr:hypothetical protein [Longimicrobium sp.]